MLWTMESFVRPFFSTKVDYLSYSITVRKPPLGSFIVNSVFWCSWTQIVWPGHVSASDEPHAVFIQLVLECCFDYKISFKWNKIITWYCLWPCHPRYLGRVPLLAEQMSGILSSTILYLTIYPSWGTDVIMNVSGLTSYFIVYRGSIILFYMFNRL